MNNTKNLQKIAKIYQQHLSKYAVIKGNDKDNWFDRIKGLELRLFCMLVLYKSPEVNLQTFVLNLQKLLRPG